MDLLTLELGVEFEKELAAWERCYEAAAADTDIAVDADIAAAVDIAQVADGSV